MTRYFVDSAGANLGGLRRLGAAGRRDDLELGWRKIMLGLQARGYQIPPYQS
ncbi:hypothetical protein [Mesorhizobium sp. ORS 3428]|uniref:hypothetical protein n=1 Tax=Mesorhizobium sp. ORS 3428 TaxID=540997 RepID=UPI0012FFD20F|nr:hypothetical protein [Mesorhizobium sp. ORS 3428]